MTKIYLLIESTGSYEDYREVPVCSFTSEEHAHKTMMGLGNVVDHLEEIDWQAWMANAEHHILGNDQDWTDEKFALLTEMENIAGVYVGYDYPSYSVQEVELIEI